VSALPSAEFWALLERDPPPLCRIAWIAVYPDPDDVLRVVFHSTSDQNFGRFKDERLDRLVEEAQRLTDQRRRMQLYHEADHLLVAEEAAIIPLGYTRTITLVQPWVKGWRDWVGPLGDLIVER
jgi:ABC-type transport system substrate-binding protein